MFYELREWQVALGIWSVRCEVNSSGTTAVPQHSTILVRSMVRQRTAEHDRHDEGTSPRRENASALQVIHHEASLLRAS
jgi:hypothetical protein